MYLEATEYERFVPNSVAAAGMHAAVFPVTVTPYPVLINAELSVFLRNLNSRNLTLSEGIRWFSISTSTKRKKKLLDTSGTK